MERNTKKALNNIENNHNHSLWQEIYERNKNNLNSVALEYRSRKITYGELFNNTEIFASYLCELGFTEGSRVLVSASKTPEFIYLLLASSKLGLIVNPIDRRLGEDNLKDIINKSDNKTIFMSDDKYEELGTLIESSTLENVVLFSLSDSLGMEDGKKFDPFDAIDRKYKKFDDKKEEIKSKSTKKVQSVNMHPENISTPVNVTLDDAFTITYTLDRDGKVKEITNDVRNYMTSIIFRELEMKDNTFFHNYGDIEYIEKDINNIEVEYNVYKYCKANYTENGDNSISIWGYCPQPTKIVKEFIDNVNDKKIILINSNIEGIKIYASKDNIEKLKNNKTNIEKNNNYINNLEKEIYEKEQKIKELEEKLDNYNDNE